MRATVVRQMAAECGFEVAGVAAAGPVSDFERYRDWVRSGAAGAMGYLTDRRADLRSTPVTLLPSARSVICVGKLYNTPGPVSFDGIDSDRGWIARYAWGDDYHDVVRAGLEDLVQRLRAVAGEFEYKICVDTAPLLERSLARDAGLGWIGRNTCLINQQLGSWLFLGELLVSIEIETGEAPPDRCGTCTRCIDACPTQALVPTGEGWMLDARLCISYLTIELKGDVPEEQRDGLGHHVFGCDICQDVCPWNRRAPVTGVEAFQARAAAPPLAELAGLTEEEFREAFRGSPVRRARYSGLLRNVAIAMGNSGNPDFRDPLLKLTQSEHPGVASHARWALLRLDAHPVERSIGEE